MPFESGQSGNPGGRPKTDKLFREALLLAVKRTDGDKTKLARIAEALVEKAASGDIPACNAVADRLDGKATQPIAGAEGGPFEIILRTTYVDPEPGSSEGIQTA